MDGHAFPDLSFFFLIFSIYTNSLSFFFRSPLSRVFHMPFSLWDFPSSHSFARVEKTILLFPFFITLLSLLFLPIFLYISFYPSILRLFLISDLMFSLHIFLYFVQISFIFPFPSFHTFSLYFPSFYHLHFYVYSHTSFLLLPCLISSHQSSHLLHFRLISLSLNLTKTFALGNPPGLLSMPFLSLFPTSTSLFLSCPAFPSLLFSFFFFSSPSTCRPLGSIL